MTITSANLGEVGELALAFGATQRQLGAATFKPVMPGEEWDAKVAADHAAWQAFSDALWALAEGEDSPQLPEQGQGQKSTPIDDPYRHPKIGTAPTFTGVPD